MNRPRRRRRTNEPLSEGMPIGLVFGLLAAGLLVCVAVVAGLVFWIVSDLTPPAPIAAGPPAQILEDPAPFLAEPDWPNRPEPLLGDMIAPLLPFVEKTVVPREPFQSQGRLVQLDLKGKINWAKNEAIDLGGNDLGDMPMGEQSFAGIKFNVQGGAILLGGRPSHPSGRPLEVAGIKVDAKFKRLYAFQSSQYTVASKTDIGGYRLRYDDGTSRHLSIVAGDDVFDWFFGRTPEAERSRTGWSGRNGASAITFFVTRYDNPQPEKTVAAVDFFATNNGAAPVCVALTIEQ
jgi:hypothetical protein